MQAKTTKSLAALIGLIFSIATFAETEKIAIPSDLGVRFVWWPKVSAPKGWHFDQGSSYHFAFNAIAPDGSTFSQTETVMYAKASYKPREIGVSDLKSFIQRDLNEFSKFSFNLRAGNDSPIVTGDDKKLEVVSFVPAAEGNWELVAYGEESEYFLTFAISSRTQNGLQEALPAFKEMLRMYHEKP